MRVTLFLSLFICCSGVGWAQSPAPATTAAEPQPTVAPTASRSVEKRIEHIQIEDAGARIDELRVGGETRNITVQPKGRLPRYDVQPVSGERSWKILDF